jgi:hypothetical protein
MRESYQQLQGLSLLVMSYIIFRGRCCHIIILNVHVQTDDKIDDMKDSFVTCVR